MSQDGNSQRDQHIRLLEEIGRIAWQKENEYLKERIEEIEMRKQEENKEAHWQDQIFPKRRSN